MGPDFEKKKWTREKTSDVDRCFIPQAAHLARYNLSKRLYFAGNSSQLQDLRIQRYDRFYIFCRQ